MGWARGSSIFDDIIDSLIEAEVDDSQKEIIYARLIETFTSHDCDTLYECLQKDDVFDKVFKQIESDYYEEDC